MHTVMQGFSVKACRWLEPDNFIPGDRVSAGDAKKRKELVEEFIWWLFEDVLIPLLKVRTHSLVGPR